MDAVYRTVEKEASAEFTERRSRFLGTIRPVADETEAQAFIARMKKTYWDATHNVYAYVLRRGQVRRYSDDGEPQGTAGVPVLDVLLKEGLTDVAVVVTRYFGGILLGAGGLVRAYSHGAKRAVEAGGPVEMRLCDRARIICEYAQYGRVAALVPEAGGTVTSTRYTDRVEVDFLLPRGLREPMQKRLTEQSAGALTIETLGEEYAPFRPDAE
ncbi:MAG TPA: IMPACT family protein [Firmicutes bacterium]|nr:IMPACT family protein [Bacillota bacterium]